MGIDELIYPEMLAARDVVNGLKMSWVRQRWDVHDGSLVMLGIKLRENAEILNQPLRQLCGPQDPYHVVAIKRNGDTIIPGGDDELKLYDIVYFMTTKNHIPYIRKIVGKEHYADVKNVMIMGGGKTAIRAVLSMPEYMNTKIIEIDERQCELINEALDDTNAMVINGDARDLNLLTDENIRNTQGFVALTGNAEANILACLTAKKLGVRKTIAMVENTNYASMAESLDIGTVINKKVLAAANGVAWSGVMAKMPCRVRTKRPNAWGVYDVVGQGRTICRETDGTDEEGRPKHIQLGPDGMAERSLVGEWGWNSTLRLALGED